MTYGKGIFKKLHHECGPIREHRRRNFESDLETLVEKETRNVFVDRASVTITRRVPIP
jgi:hypothetical protein